MVVTVEIRGGPTVRLDYDPARGHGDVIACTRITVRSETPRALSVGCGIFWPTPAGYCVPMLSTSRSGRQTGDRLRNSLRQHRHETRTHGHRRLVACCETK